MPPRSSPRSASPRQLAELALAAGLGGAALAALSVPAAWLSGAMIGVAVLAAFGRGAPLPNGLRRFAILLAGVGMGSGLTPATLHTLARYPASLVLLALALVAMTAASFLVLTRSPGFSRLTAFYSAVPGALSYVFIVAEPTGADMSRVAVIQIFRIFVLMAIVPLVARAGLGATIPHFATDPVYATALLLVVAGAAGAGLEAVGVANGYLYGGVAASALVHGVGWAPGRLAPDLQIAAQGLIGAWVGTRFIGFDWGLLHRTLIAAATSFLAAFAAAAAFAAGAAWLVGAPFADALAAFAPGGLEAMTMMAFALGLDPLFVGAHHLARFFMISFALPFASGWISGRAQNARPLGDAETI